MAALDNPWIGQDRRGGDQGGVVPLSIERLTGSQRVVRQARVRLREWPEEGAMDMLDDGAERALPLSLSSR